MENTAMNSTETIPAFKRKPEAITRRSSTRKRRQIEIEEEEEVVHDEKLEESISSSTSSDSCDDEEEEEEEEEVEVEKKIVALQRMVPGGEMLGVDKLFEETAGYILALQSQIKALRVLATFIQDFDKQNRKFGG
ncbi:hypothetical protein Dsin_030714 [Dipteronia sinensis]|uniref:Uncharacterized protein n=1 Tax=Dipteronia sinensis TaxID=43782 RepID=A0AAD9ZJT2_9ROSI|nr:hypothetical protein Dsin_030714 [Dipteronia sinensis]